MIKGFVFSTETIISLLLFSTILISFNIPKNESFTDLIIIQQQNDLMKIWGKNFPNENDIKNDTKLFFKNATVFLDEKKIIIGKECFGESIANETKIFDDNLIEKNIRIIVYKNC